MILLPVATGRYSTQCVSNEWTITSIYVPLSLHNVHRQLTICIKLCTVIFVLDRYSSLVDVCHIVGTLVQVFSSCFPPPVAKCDTRQCNHRHQFTCQVRLVLTLPWLVQTWQSDKLLARGYQNHSVLRVCTCMSLLPISWCSQDVLVIQCVSAGQHLMNKRHAYSA
jgi:hypothetical protein